MVLPFFSVFRVTAASFQSGNRMADPAFVKRGKLQNPKPKSKFRFSTVLSPFLDKRKHTFKVGVLQKQYRLNKIDPKGDSKGGNIRCDPLY